MGSVVSTVCGSSHFIVTLHCNITVIANQPVFYLCYFAAQLYKWGYTVNNQYFLNEGSMSPTGSTSQDIVEPEFNQTERGGINLRQWVDATHPIPHWSEWGPKPQTLPYVCRLIDISLTLLVLRDKLQLNHSHWLIMKFGSIPSCTVPPPDSTLSKRLINCPVESNQNNWKHLCGYAGPLRSISKDFYPHLNTMRSHVLLNKLFSVASSFLHGHNVQSFDNLDI